MKTKELSKKVKATEIHNLGKGCGMISKRLDNPVSTIGSTVRKQKLDPSTNYTSAKLLLNLIYAITLYTVDIMNQP